jgi:hypothetical protein
VAWVADPAIGGKPVGHAGLLPLGGLWVPEGRRARTAGAQGLAANRNASDAPHRSREAVHGLVTRSQRISFCKCCAHVPLTTAAGNSQSAPQTTIKHNDASGDVARLIP